MHCGCAVADPEEAGRSGQDELPRCCFTRSAVARRRIDGGVGSGRRPRGHAGSRPCAGGCGRNATCPPTAGECLHAEARSGLSAKKGWTILYLRSLQEQQFDHPAHQIALQEMVEAVRVCKERVERLERVIEEFVLAWSLAPIVRALQTLRGVDLIVAVTFATEVGDQR